MIKPENQKRKRGRPKIENNDKKKYIVYVDSETYAFYEEAGTNSVSRGMKIIADKVKSLSSK